ncbi:MAG: DedA family protein [Verrucomicrobiae bacterium]|nr:DedA family protein [Verrucomicrobiae bacterium]
MDLIHWFADWVLHLDRHLVEIVAAYGVWVYVLLFLIIFCETGLVVTPFLPGDSLLFALGALAAAGTLNLWVILVSLTVAAILGDSLNYYIGSKMGEKAFANPESRIFKRQYLERTHAFYEKYGAKTIVIARFVPIVRTFAPFVAGVGKMSYATFLTYNIVGAFVWIFSITFAGYFFGRIEIVQKNFTIVVLAIIVISVLPIVYEYVRHLLEKRKADAAAGRTQTPE